MTISRKQLFIGGCVLGVALLASGTVLVGRLVGGERKPTEKRPSVKAKHVINGHYVKLNRNDRLVYAGIRAPYENEPFYEEAKLRNAELVEGKKLRLRFEEHVFRNRKGRLFAYAFVDGLFVNETMVREGLAFVRLTPDTLRYADALLAAQAKARRSKRGIWSRMSKSDEHRYPADPKYGEFHRPACEVVPRIKPERRVELKSKREAFNQGLAPCNKCLP
ncbi:MAG: thermonuclease family protein [Phycisphaerae bacterium]